MKLNEEKYEIIYRKTEEFKQKLGIPKEIKLVLYSDSDYPLDGNNPRGTTVELTQGILDLLGTENEHVLFFMLAHELIHVKYKDTSFKRATWVIMSECGNDKANALICLMEMRANVLASSLVGLSESEIRDGQAFLQRVNNTSEGKASFVKGYPDRQFIADYCVRFKDFTEVIVDEILMDFKKIMNVNTTDFSEKVKTIFFKKCYPK
ncbi:hypothetical protein EKG37_21255 [Robertmurraya yapensis]|uniref:Peptidase M48 domain-containing protein n=1 Tax=Bacillus yapensis TaxID=2492960 RepID=A0A3S0KAX5_9BACI|nr:hypothetical protein [Bacillus yapensis]RTR26599.1 hypothetical protein EKG37_21255 [Bacillus yapensis]TKS93774.1 hypothetical protein FAR12_21260 [Bacillus yapensis]